MLKTAFLWALIAFVPLASLRMICVDHAVGGGRAGVSAQPDCSEACPRDAAPKADTKTGCVLVAGGCSAVASFIVALPAPVAERIAAAPATTLRPSPDIPSYLGPTRSPLNPPPEL